MLNCEACQIWLADAIYAPLDSRQNRLLRQHVESCETCRDLQQELRNHKAILEQSGIGSGNFDDIPERSALNDIWLNLQPALDRIDAERTQLVPQNRFRYAMAGFLALAASLVLVVALQSPRQSEIVPATPMSTNTLISPDLMNYLTRAQVMLLLVANTETENVSIVPIRQPMARTMAMEAGFLNANRENEFSFGQSKLLKDIEFLLLQIANLDDTNMEQGVQLMQEYMESNSVLLKIRLLEMRNQDQLI